MQGISRTLWEEVDLRQARAVTSVDWLTYPILDITETPETIDCVLINRPDARADRRGRALDPPGRRRDRQRDLRRDRRAHPPRAVLARPGEAGAVVTRRYAPLSRSPPAREGSRRFGCALSSIIPEPSMTVVDVHTHMLTLDWIELLRERGGPRYEVKKTKAGQETIWMDGAPFMTLMPGMWDYDLRIKAMDEAKVDLAIVSLTCPNCLLRRARGEPEGRADRQRLDGRAAARASRPHPLVRLAAVAICRRRQGRARALREGRRGRRHADRQCGGRGPDATRNLRRCGPRSTGSACRC